MYLLGAEYEALQPWHALRRWLPHGLALTLVLLGPNLPAEARPARIRVSLRDSLHS